MPNIDIPSLVREAMNDPEFSREMRFFDGTIKVAVGADESLLKFRDGKLLSAEKGTAPDDQCQIVVRGTEEHWEKMLERYPVPFFQCLQTTAVKHGLVLSTTNQTFAYLPALNRLVQFIREKHN
jgi:hypothetical protein